MPNPETLGNTKPRLRSSGGTITGPNPVHGELRSPLNLLKGLRSEALMKRSRLLTRGYRENVANLKPQVVSLQQ